MAWRAITRDDLLTAMAAAELKALEAASLGVDADGAQTATELVGEVIKQVTDYARSRLAVRYQLGAKDDNGRDTISDKVLRPCLDLIVPILQRRVQIDPSDNRVEAEKQAVKFFDMIAKGEAVVEEPEKDTSEDIGFIDPLFGNRDIVVNRANQSGI